MAETSGLILSLLAYVFPLLMVAAGVGDAMTMRIPNWLTLLIAIVFFPLALASDMAVGQIAQHVAAGAALLLVGFGLFYFGFIGGGDAKLMAAASLWFGYPGTGLFLVYTALAGGLLAIGIGLWFMIRWHAEVWGLSRGPPLKNINPDVPYGLALAAGAVIASPGSWWMVVWGG